MLFRMRYLSLVTLLILWSGDSAEAQRTTTRATAGATLQCPEGRPLFFDGKCRGQRFFEQFAVPGYQMLDVSGCTERKVGDPGACGLSFGLTESDDEGNTRVVTVTHVKLPTGRGQRGLQLASLNSHRNGYRVMHTLSTRQKVFPSGDRRVTVTHTEFSGQGQARDLFRQRMTFTNLENTAATFTYQSHMEICSNVPFSDLFQEEDGQSLTCSGATCQYVANRSEYVERLGGQLITETNVSLKRNLRSSPALRVQAQGQGGYAECMSGQGTYSGHTIIPYSGNDSDSCGPEIDALAQLPEQICDGISGIAGGFIWCSCNADPVYRMGSRVPQWRHAGQHERRTA